MPANFPTSLDDATSLPVEAANTPLATNHVNSHQNLSDAVKAIEAKVGIDSSAVNTSFDYKLSGVTTGDKAVSLTGTEVLTNKTLTSPIINVGSDAAGDVYYRNSGGAFTRLPKGSDTQVLTLASGIPSWATPTAIVDASATVKGIVEIATAAEITAGTATGGTGAILAISPDQLALSSPTFNGVNITNVTPIVGSYVGAPFSDSSTSNKSTDTTHTCNFTAKNITIYYKITGWNNGAASYTAGIATFNGTSLVSNLIFNSPAATTISQATVSIGNAAIGVGTTVNYANCAITITSVTSTQFVVRTAITQTDSHNCAVDLYVIATQ